MTAITHRFDASAGRVGRIPLARWLLTAIGAGLLVAALLALGGSTPYANAGINVGYHHGHLDVDPYANVGLHGHPW